MHFLSYGDGHSGGVCSFTDYLQANEDGAWVGLERYPHPTDTQYSWVSRLAEVYSARAKSFCRHNASFESILQEVLESTNMYDFDECYSFIGIPHWKKRLYHLYGDWGSAKNHRWSKHYHTFGIDCNMDGNDFDKEYGKQLIIEMLRTNGVRHKDTTFKSWYDGHFVEMITNLNVDYLTPEHSHTDLEKIDPMTLYHPEDERFKHMVNNWLDLKEREYLEECARINALTKSSDKAGHFMPDLLELLEQIKNSKHKFFFYFTEDSFPFPKNNSKFNYTAKKWGEEQSKGIIKTIVQLDYPNIYWFWGVCMKRFFDIDLDNAKPRKFNYYRHEDHYQFSKYMRANLIETKLI
tara:strand:+ start:1398 stop:2447 length:1050 start_codon:yes stop_codon:yes gene_type:complete